MLHGLQQTKIREITPSSIQYLVQSTVTSSNRFIDYRDFTSPGVLAGWLLLAACNSRPCYSPHQPCGTCLPTVLCVSLHGEGCRRAGMHCMGGSHGGRAWMESNCGACLLSSFQPLN